MEIFLLTFIMQGWKHLLISEPENVTEQCESRREGWSTGEARKFWDFMQPRSLEIAFPGWFWPWKFLWAWFQAQQIFCEPEIRLSLSQIHACSIQKYIDSNRAVHPSRDRHSGDGYDDQTISWHRQLTFSCAKTTPVGSFRREGVAEKNPLKEFITFLLCCL